MHLHHVDTKSSPENRVSEMFDGSPMWPALFGPEFGRVKDAASVHTATPGNAATLDEAAFRMVQRTAWFHNGELGALDESPALRHAYVNRLQARHVVDELNSALPITAAAVAALNPFISAANSAAASRSITHWAGVGTLRAFSSVCADLRMAINALGAGHGCEKLLAVSALNEIPLRLAATMSGAVGGALTAIVRAAKNTPEVQGYTKSVLHQVNAVALPALLRAYSALATPAGQSAELDSWQTSRWGLLPRCGVDVLFSLMLIEFVSSKCAPDSNLAASMQSVQLRGEWRTVEEAFLHAESEAALEGVGA